LVNEKLLAESWLTNLLQERVPPEGQKLWTMTHLDYLFPFDEKIRTATLTYAIPMEPIWKTDSISLSECWGCLLPL
jgi:hypothetical protein